MHLTGREQTSDRGEALQLSVSEEGVVRNSEQAFDAVSWSRIVAIVRLGDASPLLQVADALVRGGILCLEFTITTPGALGAIQACRARLGERALIGAGTVMTATDGSECIAAGAQFLVSPGTDVPLIKLAREQGVLSIPGALTPTEIISAWNAGAGAVKVFPARAFGPGYIRDVRAPLPNIPLIPTGGIDAGNARAYLEAGAIAVGVGGNLISKASVEAGDWEAIEAKARELVASVSS
jgi:2-dehydro-3-deoxyphosphogluconate aldolase / (4S)-4-hydroxy-2-oxoglutarate aldolase